MPIYHKYKAIFIHIPKSAGTFIHEKVFKESSRMSKEILFGWDRSQPLNHASYNKVCELTKNLYLDYYTFAFVRNPYDRLVSEFFYNINNYGRDFVKFCMNLNKMKTLNGHTKIHLMSQYEFVSITQDENIVINPHINIFKFEKFEQDMKQIINYLGINEKIDFETKVNKKGHEHFTHYYTDELIKKVNEFFSLDFTLFDYPMVQTLDELKELYPN
jgi:hypothetical protein